MRRREIVIKDNMSYSRKCCVAEEIRFGEGRCQETLRNFINEFFEHTGKKSFKVHRMEDFDKFCEEEIGSYLQVASAARYSFHPEHKYFQYCSCELFSANEVDDLIDDDYDDWEEAVQWHLDNESVKEFVEKTGIDMVEIRKAFIEWCDNSDELTVEDSMMFSDEQILTVEWEELADNFKLK